MSHPHAPEPTPQAEDSETKPEHLPCLSPQAARRASSVLAVLGVLFAIVLCIFSVQFVSRRGERASTRVEHVRIAGMQAVAHITADVRAMEATLRNLPAQVSADDLTTALRQCEAASSVTVMPADGTGLQATRDVADPSKVQIKSLARADIETLRKASGHPGWQTPYFQNHDFFIRCVRPHGDGFAAIDYAVPRLQWIADHTDLGDSGYCFVTTADGHFVWTPLQEFMFSGVTLGEVSRNYGMMKEVAAHTAATQATRVETTDDLGPRTAWCLPIPEVGWTFVIVMPVGDPASADEFGRLLVWIDISITFTLICGLLAILLRGYEGNDRRLWAASAGVSILLAAAVVGIWGLVTSGHLVETDPTAIRLTDKPSVERFKARYIDACRKSHLPVPTFIPTGLWVETLEFTSANNVVMTGILWQKYPLNTQLKEGVEFPEGVNVRFEEAYRIKKSDGEVVAWRFQGTMRQRFDYRRYPFDLAQVWIRVWPQSLQQDVVCAPDVDAYKFLRPLGLPGLQDDLVLSGWSQVSSAFEYRKHSYYTDFGLSGTINDNVPDLYFTVDLRRNFMFAFLLNLVPMLVIATLLYVVTIITTYRSKKLDAYGLKPSGVLSTCSGLLFAALLAHTKLRTDFAAQSGVIYLESFYFILYAYLLLVPLNSFLVAADLEWNWLRRGDNAWPNFLFWPVMLGCVVLLTLWYFL